MARLGLLIMVAYLRPDGTGVAAADVHRRAVGCRFTPEEPHLRLTNLGPLVRRQPPRA